MQNSNMGAQRYQQLFSINIPCNMNIFLASLFVFTYFSRIYICTSVRNINVNFKTKYYTYCSSTHLYICISNLLLRQNGSLKFFMKFSAFTAHSSVIRDVQRNMTWLPNKTANKNTSSHTKSGRDSSVCIICMFEWFTIFI